MPCGGGVLKTKDSLFECISLCVESHDVGYCRVVVAVDCFLQVGKLTKLLNESEDLVNVERRQLARDYFGRVIGIGDRKGKAGSGAC